MSSSFRDLLNNPNTSLQDVLLDDCCISAYRYNDNQLVWFLLDRSEEILNLAIYSTNAKVSLKANLLLSKEYHALIDDIVEKEIFVPTIERYLDNEPSPAVICKIANLASIVYESAASQFTSELLIRFLPHIGDKMILSLYETVLEKASDPEQLIPLVTSTLSEISNFTGSVTDDVNDENAVHLGGLYKLTSLFNSNTILSEIVQKPENIAILVKKFEVANINLLDSQWECIDQFVCQTNAAELEKSFVSVILPLVGISDPALFHQYQAKMLHIILKLAQNSENVRKILVEVNFHAELREIVETYPHHTLAHLAVTDFIIAASRMTELEALILTQMLPLCEKILSNPDSLVELRAFAWNLICKFRDTIKTGNASSNFQESIEAFDEVSSKRADELSEIANSDYGGPLPDLSISADADSFLSNLTQQQVMQLLRLLTQRPR